MADVTFGVKMPEELKKQIEDLMKDAGLRTNKDFMQSLVNSYIVEKTKESIPEIAEDLKELQVITQRTNDIYLNMGYRIENINKANEKESEEQLSKKDSTILELKEKIEMINFENSNLEESNSNIVNQNNIQIQRVNELTEININVKELNEGYKQKNDDLMGIVSEYKQYKIEIEKLKVLLGDKQAQSIDLSNSIRDKDNTIENLEKSIQKATEDNKRTAKDNENERITIIDRLKKDNIKELESIKKENELNNKLAILELKEVHQGEMEKIQSKYNSNIELYQNKYNVIVDRIEELRSTPNPNKIINKKSEQ